MIHRIRTAKINIPFGYEPNGIGRKNIVDEASPATASVSDSFSGSASVTSSGSTESFFRFFNLLIGVEGDSSSQLTNWVINSRYTVLYWKLTNLITTRTVKIYSDSAGTIEVSTGSRVGNGAITMNQTGGTSGVYGSVTVAYVVDDLDTENNKLLFSNGLSLSRIIGGCLMNSVHSNAAIINVESELQITAMDFDWSESITWNTKPVPSGTQLNFKIRAPIDDTGTLDLANDFFMDNIPDPCFGFAVILTTNINPVDIVNVAGTVQPSLLVFK